MRALAGVAGAPEVPVGTLEPDAGARRYSLVGLCDIFLEPEFRRDGFEGADRAPQPMRHPGLGREIPNEVQSHVELGATLGTELHGSMRGGEKQDSDGRGKELMVEHLTPAVQVRGGVDVRQQADRLLCQFDRPVSK